MLMTGSSRGIVITLDEICTLIGSTLSQIYFVGDFVIRFDEFLLENVISTIIRPLTDKWNNLVNIEAYKLKLYCDVIYVNAGIKILGLSI